VRASAAMTARRGVHHGAEDGDSLVAVFRVEEENPEVPAAKAPRFLARLGAETEKVGGGAFKRRDIYRELPCASLPSCDRRCRKREAGDPAGVTHDGGRKRRKALDRHLAGEEGGPEVREGECLARKAEHRSGEEVRAFVEDRGAPTCEDKLDGKERPRLHSRIVGGHHWRPLEGVGALTADTNRRSRFAADGQVGSSRRKEPPTLPAGQPQGLSVYAGAARRRRWPGGGDGRVVGAGARGVTRRGFGDEDF